MFFSGFSSFSGFQQTSRHHVMLGIVVLSKVLSAAFTIDAYTTLQRSASQCPAHARALSYYVLCFSRSFSVGTSPGTRCSCMPSNSIAFSCWLHRCRESQTVICRLREGRGAFESFKEPWYTQAWPRNVCKKSFAKKAPVPGPGLPDFPMSPSPMRRHTSQRGRPVSECPQS